MSELIVYEGEQGTLEWLSLRSGVPTASKFSDVMAKGEGKTRKSYMYKLASEVVTGEPLESFKSAAMERGNIMEAEARDWYAFQSNADLHKVCFVRNGKMGCSPDSMIGKDGLLEIKTHRGDLQIALLLDKQKMPPEHKAQVQGQLMVAEREWCDFVSYWPKLPPFCIRVYRDESYIATMRTEIARFNEELDALVAKIRAM